MQCEEKTALRSLGRWWPWHLKDGSEEISGKASATIHLFKSIDLDRKDCSPSGTSTSSMWQDAINLYIKQLPEKDRQCIISTKDDSALTVQSLETLMSPLIAQHKHGTVMKLLMKFGPTLQHIRSFATVVDVAVQSHPNAASLIWGGVRLILEISSRALELLVEVSELFERLSTYLPVFEKWAILFPRAEYEELSECLVRTYLEYINALVTMIRFLRGSGIGNLIRTAFRPSFRTQFKVSETKIENLTRVLVLHVETARISSSMQRDQQISRLLNSIPNGIPSHPTVQLPVRFLQVMPRNDRYYERGPVMDQMTALLAGQDSRLSSVALYGFVGCGKSSIATEYVYRHLHLFEAIVCFDASDKIKLERQVVQLARHLGFAAQEEDPTISRRLILDWLSMTVLKWLIVFNDADDTTTLRAFWPAASHGAIIVTSRDPLVQDEGLATSAIRVLAFDQSEGANFLLSFLNRPDNAAAEDRIAASMISEHFSGWPMGLRITAAFIRDKRLTPSRFVRLQIEQETKSQQCRILGSSTMGISVFELALSDIPADANELLDYLSLLDPREIPVDLVDTPTYQYLDARVWLSSRSLILYDESQNFISIDRYFQGLWLKKLVETPHKYNLVLKNVLQSLLALVPEPNLERPRDPALWKLREMYVAHIRHLEQCSRTHLVSYHISPLLSLIVRCVHYFFEVGDYRKGFDHIEIANSIVRQYDITDSGTLSTLNYVHGRLATETSQLHLCVHLFENALIHFRQLLATGEDHALDRGKTYLSRLYSCLGNALTAVNRFSEAEVCHHAALDSVSKVDEPQSSTRIGSLYANLGSCLLWQGKYAQAEELLQKSLLRHDRGLECNWYALGNVYLRQGRLKKAFEFHRRVLESFSTTLGHSHHTVADSCHKVGSIYALRDFEYQDLHQAELFLQKALDIYRTIQSNGKDYLEQSIARTEWKLAKIIQVGRDPLHAEAALMETRSLGYLESVINHKDGIPEDEVQIEEAFDNLVFFWSR